MARHPLLVAGAAGLFLIASATAQSGYHFRPMGGLPGPNGVSAANDVSGDGSTVAGAANLTTGFQAVHWRAGVFTALGDLPGGATSNSAMGVSSDGLHIVGQSGSANGFEAYLWSKGRMIGLGDLPGPGGFASFATAVSWGGRVVVGATQRPFGPLQYAAFRWTSATGMQPLGEFPGGDNFSVAFDVAKDGTVIVGSSSGSSGLEAFVWTEAFGMVGLGDLPGGQFDSSASAISGDGTIVVGRSTSALGSEAFRWTAGGGVVGLGDFPGGSYSSAATDVSSDGTVIVGSASGHAADEAFLWTPAIGMVSVRQYLLQHGVTNLAGWNLIYANGVSADGRTIVGTAVNPGGAFEGWVATIEVDPTPIDMGDVVPPSSLAVPAGLHIGGLTQVMARDDQYLVLRAHGSGAMQIVVEGTLTRPLISNLLIELESYATRSGTQRQTELFDFTSGTWVLVDTRNVPTVEIFSRVDVSSNVSGFVQPGTLRVLSRLTWRNPTAHGGQMTDVFVDGIAFARIP